MKEKARVDSGQPPATDLRQEAERRLRSKTVAIVQDMAEVDVRALLHELQVHQIELEMQNEELLRAQVALQSAPFSLRRMLDQITRVLAVRTREKGLAFSCRAPDEMPDAVTGDRLRLQQVLLNLASNAIKFTEHGEVEISLRPLLRDGEACLEFAVRDTGIGIPPSDLERLFQPFAQVDASITSGPDRCHR